MSAAIRVDHLGKEYRVGAQGWGEYRTLRETLASAFSKPADLFRTNRRESKTFWALDDVSFNVEAGDVVGIIGRNGAGKSTLLKILSRTVEPTRGRAEIHGRLGSLLEIGTGFHPELTGRENIYLNGSILGMKRKEIRQRFDEIVAFSEIERFLDTPVKRYSSGMYVRLAFAVAAHLEAEALVVDEVLAVGDLEFQKKCIGKMYEVGKSGRAVLFVSHNIQVIEKLCQRGIYLNQGTLAFDGTVKLAVREYLQSIEKAAASGLTERTDRLGNGSSRLVSVRVNALDPVERDCAVLGRPLRITMDFSNPIPHLGCIFHIVDEHGHSLAKFNSRLFAPQDDQPTGDISRLTCVIDEWLLAPGRYRLDVSASTAAELVDQIEGAAVFDACRAQVRDREPPRSTNDWCTIMPHRWSFDKS